jgi:hypothetical protein
MRGRPDEEVLRELMDDMKAMDKERLGKKRQGPSITIAVGVPKDEEKEMEGGEYEDECEKCAGAGCAECKGVEPGAGESMGMPMPEMEEENGLMFDNEEKALIEEAKALGIDDPEELDMRLLKKLIEKKKASV